MSNWRNNKKQPFTSDLSGQDFWTLIRAGYAPLGMVMGSEISWTSAEHHQAGIAPLQHYGVIWPDKLTRSGMPASGQGWDWLRKQGVKSVAHHSGANPNSCAIHACEPYVSILFANSGISWKMNVYPRFR